MPVPVDVPELNALAEAPLGGGGILAAGGKLFINKLLQTEMPCLGLRECLILLYAPGIAAAQNQQYKRQEKDKHLS